MIRIMLDRMRRLILGPHLMAFARMPKADLQQLLAIGSDELLFFEQSQDGRALHGASSSDLAPSAGVSPVELQELRMEIATLKERLSVLERINYQKSASDMRLPRETNL